MVKQTMKLRKDDELTQPKNKHHHLNVAKIKKKQGSYNLSIFNRNKLKID